MDDQPTPAPDPATPREPGYAGLLAAGHTPQQAWQAIHDDLAADPEALAILTGLASTPEGRATLECVRQAWARKGLPAPFDGLANDNG